jgi:N4-gp56 family major capsid protein
MGLGTNQIIKSDVPNFIPQLWSDEVIASYKSNLVMANLVRVLNHRGKKGDTIKIPTPTRGAVSSKAANTQVTLIAHGTDTGLTVSINKHKEYSRLIEDIVDVQALASLRRFYTDDAGYAIAKRVDRELILEAAAFGTGPSGSGNTIVEDASTGNIDSTSTMTNMFTGDGVTAWDKTASANAGNAVDLSDLGIRRLIKKLDDVDAPLSGRYLVIPPVVKADMMGLARFSEQAFTGETARGNTIRNGLVGDVYGVEVYITNNLQKVEDAGSAIDQDFALFFQRDALLLIEQMGVRTQQQYKQEYLGDLFTADMIYGVKGLRATSILPIVVPSTFTDG